MSLTLFLLGCVLLLAFGQVQAQSLRKLEQRAINRTHLTFVNGDTVQRFTITYAHPHARPNRFYYWQGPTQILRTAGAYNGHLLTGGYQLTSRNGNLLGSGYFRKGLKTGLWRTWRPDGTPVSSNRWQRGRQRGLTKYYDETGQLRKSAPTPKQATPVASATASPHFWQAAYWQALVQRRKLRHQEKKKALSTPPVPTKQPTNATPANEGKKKKSKSTVTPSPAPPLRSGS